MIHTTKTVIEIIRKFHGIPQSVEILESTYLEKGLGITGDDGSDLIEFIQEELDINFFKTDESFSDAFELNENEYLFHSEGIHLPFFFKKEKVKEIKVKDMVVAVNKASL